MVKTRTRFYSHISKLFASSIIALSALWSRQAPAQKAVGDSLSMEQCVDLALKNNVDILTAKEQISESIAQKKSARGNFGPKIKLEGNVMRWDSPSEVSFFGSGGIDPTSLPPPATPYEEVLAGMMQSLGGEMTVREQTTWSVSAVIAQPLTPLYAIYLSYHLQDLGREASEIKHVMTQRNTVYEVRVSYLRILQARQYVAIAQDGVSQVQAHVDQAKKFFNANVIGRNDLLKAELGLANAKNGLIQASAGFSLARAGLANLIGMDIPENTTFDSPFGVTDGHGDDSARESFERPLEECIREARSSRLELLEIEKRLDQARTGKSLAWSQFIPNISAVGNYTHMEGSAFQEENSFFIGGMLSWDIFEWGNKYYQVKAAESKIRQVEMGLRKVRDLLALEVKKNYLDLHKAKESLNVAVVAIRQAEENLRIENARYSVNANTSTDVLDAQNALRRALNQKATAYYNYLIALESLKRSIGVNPLSSRPEIKPEIEKENR